GQFGTNSKNIELLGISLEKGFPINDNKIKELFENQEKIIMNLPLEHKNEKEIQNFYSLIGDIKEFIVKSKSGINIELLEKSKGNIKSFKEIQQNSFPEKIKESFKNFYKNNKGKFKDGIKEEDLEKVDFSTIEKSLKGFRELFKEDIKEGNLQEIAKIYKEILHYESEENIKKRKELEQGLNPYIVKKLTSNINIGKLKENIACNGGQCTLGNNDFAALAIEAIGSVEAFESLGKKGKETAVELVKSQAKEVEIEIKKKKVDKIIDPKNTEYRKKYLDFANGKIDEFELKEEVKKLDEKEKLSQTSAQTGPTMTKDGQNYFIKSGDEKIKLNDTEAEEIKNNPKKIEAVLKFKDEMDDLGLGFLWNHRKKLSMNLKNNGSKFDYLDENGIGDEGSQEQIDLLNFVGKNLGFSESDKYENIKKQFEENKNKTYFEVNGKKYNTINPGNIFEEILIGKKEGEKGKLIINGEWQEQEKNKKDI
ncbi:MAG: hypothetical protein PHR68_05050, partial [Candidatus Gracilibacteria bacterium]|nr:hypothetical protein [Candidatus Gracilibacteria bacterium]